MIGGTISQNYILPNGETYGGGVFNSLTGGTRLLGVQVEGNSAVNGGGIYTSGKLVLAQNTSISDNNKASRDGAGIYVKGGTAIMNGGGVTNNTAQRNGGGIYVLSGQLMLRFDVNVSRNTAVDSDLGGFGGGIYISDGKVTVSGGTMTNNAAGASGGGIYNYTGILTLEESVNITDNAANNEGGRIYLQGAPKLDSTTTFNDVLVAGNQTDGSQKTTGWGVYWENGANVTIIALTDNDDPNGTPSQ
jgi:predicted outer membrane repeat protein